MPVERLRTRVRDRHRLAPLPAEAAVAAVQVERVRGRRGVRLDPRRRRPAASASARTARRSGRTPTGVRRRSTRHIRASPRKRAWGPSTRWLTTIVPRQRRRTIAAQRADSVPSERHGPVRFPSSRRAALRARLTESDVAACRRAAGPPPRGHRPRSPAGGRRTAPPAAPRGGRRWPGPRGHVAARGGLDDRRRGGPRRARARAKVVTKPTRREASSVYVSGVIAASGRGVPGPAAIRNRSPWSSTITAAPSAVDPRSSRPVARPTGTPSCTGPRRRLPGRRDRAAGVDHLVVAVEAGAQEAAVRERGEGVAAGARAAAQRLRRLAGRDDGDPVAGLARERERAVGPHGHLAEPERRVDRRARAMFDAPDRVEARDQVALRQRGEPEREERRAAGSPPASKRRRPARAAGSAAPPCS